jgi:hypothetical protein
MAKFKYLGTSVTNTSDIHEVGENKLNWGTVGYFEVQDLLSSRHLTKNVRIKIHEFIISPSLLCWSRASSLTLRVERRFRVYENRLQRKYLDLRERKSNMKMKRFHNEKLLNDFCRILTMVC